MTHYTGSCHCGHIRFEVDGELESTVACNCSLCSRNGALMWFVPRGQLHVLSPASDLSTYTFNTHRIQHRFCPVCGIHPFGEGNDREGRPMAAINVRCLEGIDPEALPVTHFDGRAL